MAISTAWFMYDIYYVWISATVQKLNIETILSTTPSNFSLALVVPGESTGLADLFFAILLLSQLKKLRSRIIACILFIGSNIALEIYVYTTLNTNAFPLLVLWVPLGLSVFLFDRQTSKRV